MPLADERFWPLYERADALGAVVFVHPTHPAGVEAMREYWLMPLVGFPFDTTLAAAHLVFSGVVERFPRIRWVLGHLGGAIPYIAERLDRGYQVFPECRRRIHEPPSGVRTMRRTGLGVRTIRRTAQELRTREADRGSCA